MQVNIVELKEFLHGIIRCPKCSFPVENAPQLEVAPCKYCDAPLFYPLRMKNYLLYRPLGGGGMGHVYKAVRLGNINERFAVKIIQREKRLDPGYIKSLIKEAESGLLVGKHPNLVEVIEYGYDGDEHFIAYPFVSGERLDILIKRKKRFSEKRAVDIALQIINAEMHICSFGYLYRDLKPENIIIERDGNVKIIDYGLCIPVQEAAAHEIVPDELEGSPFYIPPERIVGASEGQYSEIYSLGMILFHMLKGAPYFSETEITNILTKHVNSFRVITIQGHLRDCSEKITSIIDKMIARMPNARYFDFQSLKKDMDELNAELLKMPSVILKSGGFRAEDTISILRSSIVDEDRTPLKL